MFVFLRLRVSTSFVRDHHLSPSRDCVEYSRPLLWATSRTSKCKSLSGFPKGHVPRWGILGPSSTSYMGCLGPRILYFNIGMWTLRVV